MRSAVRLAAIVVALAILATPQAAGAQSAEAQRVGLITGDVVTVSERPGGGRAVDVELAAREGYKASYEVREEAGQVYVVPSDAQSLLGRTLDRELFNVTKLLDYGYDLERGLPVIVMRDAGAPRLRSTAGVSDVVALGSLGGEAATVEGSGFWHAATETRGLGTAMDGVGHVWLDEQVKATLDVSAPMVGAPHAWAQGLDGSGVKVAVLDTGIDAGHADVAGRIVAERNFTFTESVGDRYGHGTHVAGIVAGSGAASGGRYVGVAPRASLLNGKVLDDTGFGLESWTIAGMEWAAEAGADVVNLSLGSSFPSNGRDPVSLAIDRLTTEDDVVFVVSAGNSGPGGGTIGSPAAASSALTVGAIDRAGALARFSSRGPRPGDGAVKPDLTAPGVGIASARAGGSALGTPVELAYTRLSGTSMAAPHVAGAAAIVRQRRPQLSAATVKSLLVSTAAPNAELDVYRQGGGRLDIAAALAAPVRVTSAPLDLGSFPAGGGPPVSKQLTYTNDLERPLELSLDFDVTNLRTRERPSAAMLALDRDRLTLAAGASATVTVTLDVDAGEFGLYGGHLLARDAGGRIVSRVPVGFRRAAPTYTLRVEARDRTGALAGGLSGVDVLGVHDLKDFSTWRGFNGQAVTLEVPHGTYAIIGRIANAHPVYGQERSLVTVPELEVTNDTTVVLDARTATPVEIEAPERGVAPLPHVPVTLGIRRETAVGQSWAVAEAAPPEWRLYAAPTDPVRTGQLELFSRRLLGRSVDPVLYDLVAVASGRVPADLRYAPRASELARVVSRYHSDLPNQVIRGTRFVALPGWTDVDELGVTEEFNVPVERVEYTTGGVSFHRRLDGGGRFGAPAIVGGTETYAAGERRTRTWFERPMAPGVREAHRLGDTLYLSTSPWVDAGGNATDGTAAYDFYRDGELVASGAGPKALPLAAAAAEYRLALRSAFSRSWWRTATAASTAWTFRSARPAGSEPAPLLGLDYELGLDLRNTVPRPQDRNGPSEVEISVRPAGAPVAGARLWTSYDDGATWRERAGRALGGGRYRFGLDSRAGDFVSLRVDAWDARGNRIEQEIMRAFALAPRHAEPAPPGSTERVSVTAAGTQANGGASAPPAISADGRYVAFTSLATNLVPGAPGVAGSVFVRDRRTGMIKRASVASDGTPSTGTAPAISADGRYVAFASYASNLVPGDTNGAQDVFVHDRATGRTERVSVATDGGQTERWTSSSEPSLSADGRYVAFTSGGSNLVPGDTNNAQDVFVRDRTTGATERVSVAGDGTQGDSFSSETAISADGRYVAFGSFSANLVPGDGNRAADVFVRDRAKGTTERVSVATDGGDGNGFTSGPAISADGRYVAFAGGSTNLVAGDTNEGWDVFLRDRATGRTERVSVAGDGGEANDGSLTATTLAGDGRYVAFASGASNLVPGDTNGQTDVFVRDRG